MTPESIASPSDELLAKTRRIKLVITDVDGVLTDGRALYIDAQTQGVLFNVHDGTGIKYLQRSGIQTAIISGRDTAAVSARAETLGIREVVQGAKIKIEAYKQVMGRNEFEDAQVAYVGDDLPDMPVMRRAGLGIAVPNAAPEVLEQADAVTTRSGGQGALRELAEFILKAQGLWEKIMERYI